MDRLLVLTRHGQSEWNLKNLFTGWKDVDLTEVGVAEAKAAGKPVRKDDDPDVFKTRLDAYFRDTAAVTPHYRAKGVLREVDGMAGIDEVSRAIDVVLAPAA